MYIEGTHCCGIGMLADLEADEFALKRAMYEAKSASKGIVLATINQHEKKHGLGEFLTQQGFKFMHRFHNPNSGNTVYIYRKSTARVKYNEEETAQCAVSQE